MQRQLDAFGLDYRFVEVDFLDKYELKSKAYRIRVARMLGIDKQALESKYAAVINFVKNKPNRKYHELASLAIGLSHIKVYNLMIENNHEMACILEDDAKLLPTFPEVLKTTLDLEWDILQFCHQPELSFFYPFLIRYFRKIGFLSFPNFRLLSPNNTIDKQMIKEYGFDNPRYSKPEAYIKKTMQLYRNRYKSIIKPPLLPIIRTLPGAIRKFLIPKSDLPFINNLWGNRLLLEINTIIELGVPPRESKPDIRRSLHC